MATEQSTAAKTTHFEREWRFLQEVTAAAQNCGFKGARFALTGDGKDRVITVKVSCREDDAALMAAGQTELDLESDGVGPARAEEHNDAAFRQGPPQIAPPSTDRPWYMGPSGPDEGSQP